MMLPADNHQTTTQATKQPTQPTSTEDATANETNTSAIPPTETAVSQDVTGTEAATTQAHARGTEAQAFRTEASNVEIVATHEIDFTTHQDVTNKRVAAEDCEENVFSGQSSLLGNEIPKTKHESGVGGAAGKREGVSPDQGCVCMCVHRVRGVCVCVFTCRDMSPI